MTKEQFFGRCIGQKVRTPQQVDRISPQWLNYVLNHNGCPYNISDCQIIGRRISQMTAGEREKYKSLKISISNRDSWDYYDTFESIEYLSDIGIFPDKYFELKWCVEA